MKGIGQNSLKFCKRLKWTIRNVAIKEGTKTENNQALFIVQPATRESRKLPSTQIPTYALTSIVSFISKAGKVELKERV